MSWQLRDDQIEDLAYFMNHKLAINGNEPGTGKTPVTCVEQAWRWKQHQAGTLWVQPKALMKKNVEEMLRFGGWSPDEITIVDGTPAQVQEQMLRPDKVKLMGFSRFAKIMRQGGFPERFRALDVDEFHKGFGGHESKQTGAMYKFMQEQAEWFRPMSGSIINGKLDTAFPVINVIEPRYYGTYDAFKNFHYVMDLWTNKRVGYREHKHLGEVLQQLGTNRKWVDIHGAEDKVIQIETCDMEPEQFRLYAEFEKEALLELDNFFVDGTQPGVAFARARQIMECPNFFPDLRFPDSNKTVDIIPGRRAGKMELLDLHLTNHANLGTPVVVFSGVRRQQLEIYELAKSLGLRVGLVTRHVTDKERYQNDAAFRRGELDALVASSIIAEAGFNWQFWGPKQFEVSHCIFAALPYTDTTFFQAYHRFMREARRSALRITVMKYANSLDFRLAQIINKKSADAHLVDPAREILHL